MTIFTGVLNNCPTYFLFVFYTCEKTKNLCILAKPQERALKIKIPPQQWAQTS
jgi:hypothetical protein